MYREIYERLLNREGIILNTTWTNNEGKISNLYRTLTNCEKNAGSLEAKLIDEYHFVEPITPKERLIILGGGHVAIPICSNGAQMGFSVTIIEDRKAFATKERFPDATQIICGDYIESLKSLHITSYDYVVIVTRGHRSDSVCLKAILDGELPAYLGMIGSRNRVHQQLEILKNKGYPSEILDKICTPIGLSIGAITPYEISISILAQIICYKRKPNQYFFAPKRTVNTSDLELDVLKYLAEHEGQPMAMATIINTRGSSPRKEGAKMLILPDGKIIGTIGGGMMENISYQEGLELIGTGRYKILYLNMQGKVAANDGMVCGGNMDVLVEDLSISN